jgi:hypothetical protein
MPVVEIVRADLNEQGSFEVFYVPQGKRRPRRAFLTKAAVLEFLVNRFVDVEVATVDVVGDIYHLLYLPQELRALAKALNEVKLNKLKTSKTWQRPLISHGKVHPS